jgi:hypothetical protein
VKHKTQRLQHLGMLGSIFHESRPNARYTLVVAKLAEYSNKTRLTPGPSTNLVRLTSRNPTSYMQTPVKYDIASQRAELECKNLSADIFGEACC